MRTSLNELQEIEQHLSGGQDPQDSLLFHAKQVLDPGLNEKIFWQERSYHMIEQYGRKQLRKEIAEVENMLFQSPKYQNFRTKVLRYFRL